MKPVRSFTLRGEQWFYRETPHKLSVDGDELDGDCFVDKKMIRVRADLTGERKLEVIMHEAGHGAQPDLCEEAVQEIYADIARLLWRLGYRNINELELPE